MYTFKRKFPTHPKVSLKTTFMILGDAQKPIWGTTFEVILGDQIIS